MKELLRVLTCIAIMLETYFEERRAHLLEMKLAAEKPVWVDAATAKFMLRVSDRTLYEYVRKGKVIYERRGNTNFYLESSILELMHGKNFR